jgi:predicted nucleic acid-binding Zn finger protein
MKSLYVLFLCCFISCTTVIKPLDPCYVDTGIKKAKIYDKEDVLGVNTKDFMTVEFDKNGKAITVVNTKKRSTSRFVYVDEVLKYVINSGPDLFFYSEEDLQEMEIKIDTLFIAKNDNKGRVLEGIDVDNVKYEYTYLGCKEESITVYNANEKQNTVYLLKENGNIITRATTFYFPVESTITSNYINYKFDKHGHWIERSLKDENGSIFTEVRELEHY